MLLKPIRAGLLAAVLILPALTGWLARELRVPGRAGAPDALVEVGKGRSARAVISGLRTDGVVRKAFPLRVACRLFYPEESFKAGEYLLSPSLSPKENLFRLFHGRIHLQSLTVPEGLTGREIAEFVRPGSQEGQAAFLRAFLATSLIADIDPQAGDLEGYLFPETYNLPRKTTEAELIAAMVGGFRRAFDEDRRRRAAEMGLSARQVVILASLIEEETALADERPLVSAVFHNRLRIGMKLDCDPTVIYALKREGLYKGRLLSRDLKRETPYNTYLHAGLPPGPISNPGLASIDAALHPALEKYLYFVLQADGSHRFSRTLGEHLDAVRRYQELKKR